jgi:hypothetical protein
MIQTPTLWHYTTPEAAEALGESGLLYPAISLIRAKDLTRSHHSKIENMAQQLVWLSDMDELDCPALGLVVGRVYHRYQVVDSPVQMMPWQVVRKDWPKHVRKALETDGTEPNRWWVTRGPVPVIHSSYDYC